MPICVKITADVSWLIHNIDQRTGLIITKYTTHIVGPLGGWGYVREVVGLLLSIHRYLAACFGCTAEKWSVCRSENAVTAVLKDSVSGFQWCLMCLPDQRCSDYSRIPLFSPASAARGGRPQQASPQSWLFRLYFV